VFSVNDSTKDLSDAGIDTAILSVGATQQCGPHLPLNIDTLVAEYYARAWGQELGAYVLPTIPFNTSEEHASFKGTVSLRPSTMMLMLEEIVEGLRGQGSASRCSPWDTEARSGLGRSSSTLTDRSGSQ
jgi:creatinine amidohydrolase